MLRILLASAAIGVSLFGLSACTSNSGSSSSSTSQANATQTPEPAPTFVPGGTAADNEKFFNYVLRQAIRDGMEINGVNVVNTVVNAGFEKAALQVSYDSSRTGLAADNIFISVHIADQCLIGQVVTAEKTVTTDVQPAIGPDKSVCLIGETRPIDW